VSNPQKMVLIEPQLVE